MLQSNLFFIGIIQANFKLTFDKMIPIEIDLFIGVNPVVQFPVSGIGSLDTKPLLIGFIKIGKIIRQRKLLGISQSETGSQPILIPCQIGLIEFNSII